MGSIYYSHDANARHDPKMVAIKAEFGNDVRPYAWFFMLLEIMREHEADGYRIKLSKAIKKGLCLELSISSDDLEFFIKTACEIELFAISEDGYLYSESFLCRMSQKDEITQKRREAAMKRWSQATGKKPEPDLAEAQITASERDIFDAWNSTSEDANLTRHSKLSPKIKTKIRSAVREGYTPEQIIKAINNYAEIMCDPVKYYFDYHWELVEFLVRGLAKFSSANYKTNHLRNKNNQKYKEAGGDDVKFGRK